MSDIPDDISSGNPDKIPVDDIIGDDNIKPDDKLVGAIRITNGIIHPILVKDLKNGKYQVKVGKRRLSAYRILKKEDSRYDKIKAYVTDRDLDDE